MQDLEGIVKRDKEEGDSQPKKINSGAGILTLAVMAIEYFIGVIEDVPNKFIFETMVLTGAGALLFNRYSPLKFVEDIGKTTRNLTMAGYNLMHDYFARRR